MTRINLRIYLQPGQAETFVSIRRHDDTQEFINAIIDTGAEISVFPVDLLQYVPHRLSSTPDVEIEQAGIAKQRFIAKEAYIKISLEDAQGNRTDEFEIRAWFADTGRALLGFEGLLEQAVLHIDMPQRDGWVAFTSMTE